VVSIAASSVGGLGLDTQSGNKSLIKNFCAKNSSEATTSKTRK
jgi:hypothetical protein